MIRRCSRLATLAVLMTALAWSIWPTIPTRAQTGSMMEPPLDQLSADAFDQAFLEHMSMHHAMAVMMVRPVTANAIHQEFKDLGNTISAGQTKEIAQMRAWAKDWYGLELPDYLAIYVAMLEGMHGGPMPESQPGGMMGGMGPGMMGNMSMGHLSMTADMGKLAPPRLEAAFLIMMIPHHESAIRMAQLVPDRAAHQELKELAVQIIASQSAEIDQMNSWLAAWYGL